MADLLVRVRLSGPAPAVRLTSERLRMVLSVAGESGEYPNHRDPGVCCYLDVLVSCDDLHDQEVAVADRIGTRGYLVAQVEPYRGVGSSRYVREQVETGRLLPLPGPVVTDEPDPCVAPGAGRRGGRAMNLQLVSAGEASSAARAVALVTEARRSLGEARALPEIRRVLEAATVAAVVLLLVCRGRL